MSVDAAAAACAARSLGYPSFADTILDRDLPTSAVADLLRRYGAGKDGMIVAIVVLAASTARWRVQRDGWNGATEEKIAREVLHNDAAFRRAASRAAKIVAQHWSEIATDS